MRVGIYYAPPAELSVAHYYVKSVEECYARSKRMKAAAGNLRPTDFCNNKGEVCDVSMLQYVHSHVDYTSSCRLQGSKGSSRPKR